MSGGASPGRNDIGKAKILLLLDALQQTEAGQLIYQQVERMLSDVAERQSSLEQLYLGIAQALLDAYAQHLPQGSKEKVQLKLLQVRMQPPLSDTELQAIAGTVQQYGERIQHLSGADTAVFHQAVTPLLAAFGIEPNGVTARTSGTVEADPPAPVADVPVTSRQEEHSSQWNEEDLQTSLAADPRVSLSDPLQGAQPAHEQPQGRAEQRVDLVYRSHLDAKRRDIQKLQSTLTQRVLETITQNEEFGVLLEVVLGELHQVSDGEELEETRWTLIREIEKLNKGHHELAEKLDSTHHYLQLIESDSRQLSDELTRVRLLSLTDELTGLPNRRAFLRRLEDEVARVQRYGFPLSLALIDLDHFKEVNDRYGHAGGDEVLSTYSKSVLSIFRHHDLVARYGGEEFAVLLPNTDSEGSQRALNKVMRRGAETRWRLEGELLPMPTFSAGVSLYKPGETVGAFIERADKALYRAKRLGRNRVELDSSYPMDETGDDSSEQGPAVDGLQGSEET